MSEEAIPPVPPPPESVKLTTDEVGDIIDHINRKAISPIDACPVCGDPNNEVVSDLYRLDVLYPGPMIGGSHQPLISTVCNNCGFVRVFNRLVVERRLQAEKAVNQTDAPPEGGNGG
jgi:hypothetical protein